MINKTENELVLKLTEMLSEKQVNTKAVSASLELLCVNFSFDCGLVYEADQMNRFHLKEQYPPSGAAHKPVQFEIDLISPAYRAFLAAQTAVFISTAGQNSEDERNLLNLFSARSLVQVSIIDEHSRIFALVVFLNVQEKKTLSADGERLFSILLSLFARYIEIRVYQNKLTFAQTSLETILDNTGIDIYVNDFFTHDVLYVNKSMAAPYGGVDQFMKQKCWQVLFPGQKGQCEFCPQKKLIDQYGNLNPVYTWDYQRAFDGSWFRVFSAAFRWVNGRLAHVVSSADITSNKKNEELINYLANYDALTGLPNRRRLINDCAQRINGEITEGIAYLLFFDIDGFKTINDSFGHDAGDEFLIQLGNFFSTIPLLKNAIYRNGGDEFVAVFGKDISEENIRNLASFIHERFEKPWNLKKGDVFCKTSIGAAHYPEDGTIAEQLLQKADQAMYAVKKTGGNGICFGYQLS